MNHTHMGHSIFISDLHLCESRPQITKAFIAFLSSTATQADALYILGDLFEYWAGDDAIEAGVHAKIISALHHLSQQNIAIYLMHGNRDFLLGDAFSKATGIKILPDPTLVALYGKSVLLSHGDQQCTDDVDYQQFRQEVRASKWKTQFLAQPLADRIAYIDKIRARSKQEKSIKSMDIMDVNKEAIENLFAEYNYPPMLIHGHTHRPMKHTHTIHQHHCERWVLGDWYEQGSYLKLDSNGCHVQTL